MKLIRVLACLLLAVGVVSGLEACGSKTNNQFVEPSGQAVSAQTSSGSHSSSAVASASPKASASASCGEWDCAQAKRFEATAALIKTKPGSLGMVVYDRKTEAIWTGGTASHVMWASSTVKLAMATSILERGREGDIIVDSTAKQQISAMLHVSDNDAADALWSRYGKDSMITRFQEMYSMGGLKFVSGFPRTWGFIKCSAQDLQHLMTYILNELNATDREFILAGMRNVGSIQQWGVWAAGSSQSPATKDGWSIESDSGTKHWCVSTVGSVGTDARYVVAAMYDVPASGGSVGLGVHAVSDAVATAFGAKVPAVVTVPDPSTGL